MTLFTLHTPPSSDHFVLSPSSASSSPAEQLHSHQDNSRPASHTAWPTHLHKCGSSPFPSVLVPHWIPHPDIPTLDDPPPLLVDQPPPHFFDQSSIYPSPPLTDSELKRTVPLPQVPATPADPAQFWLNMPDNLCLQLPPSPPSTLPLTSRALPEAGGEPSGSRSPEGYADEIVVDTDPRDPYVSRAESCGPSDDDDLDDLLTPLSPTWPVRFRHNVPSPEGLEESALLSRSPSFMPMADASLDEPMNEEEGAPGGQGGSRAFFDAAGLPPLRHDTLWVDDSDAMI